jgi:hypothetical protein
MGAQSKPVGIFAFPQWATKNKEKRNVHTGKTGTEEDEL